VKVSMVTLSNFIGSPMWLCMFIVVSKSPIFLETDARLLPSTVIAVVVPGPRM